VPATTGPTAAAGTPDGTGAAPGVSRGR
jgi:hypothetical protein